MIVTIHPSTLSGTVKAPASKSSMQRACAAALLKKGTTIIRNPGFSNDDQAILKLIEALGAAIEMKKEEIQISSEGVLPITDRVNCGESGLGLRMFTPIIALSDKSIRINGEGSLLNRPINFFDEILPQLGVQVSSNNGKLPLQIQGPLQPANIEVDGSLSSQFLTGLLMAYAASPNPSKGGGFGDSGIRNVTIRVKNLKSKPYIDLTLDVMKKFRLNVPENRNYEEFFFNNESSKAPPTGGLASGEMEGASYTVEGDWSGAAFLLVAGAIAGNIEVAGLDISSAQADKVILQVLKNAGADFSFEADRISIHPGNLKAFYFNATDCPDLFPPLVALASFCKGKSVIEGVGRLVHKESNRAITLQKEFGKMGVKIEIQDDQMFIFGGDKVKGAVVHSHHDHRIAMACAVAALKAEGETVIEDAQAINKSYPGFFEHLKLLKANINVQ